MHIPKWVLGCLALLAALLWMDGTAAIAIGESAAGQDEATAGPEEPAPPGTETAIEPDALEVVRRLAAHLEALSSYTVTLTSTMDMEAGGMKREVSSVYHLAVKRPDHFALTGDGETRGANLVSDGKELTIHIPSAKRYFEVDSATFFDSPMAGMDPVFILLPILISETPEQTIMQNVDRLAHRGMESIGGRPCHRLYIDQQGYSADIWIEDAAPPLLKRFFVDMSKLFRDMPEEPSPGAPSLKGAKMTLTVDMDGWDLDARLPDSFFVFTPPPETGKTDPAELGMGPSDRHPLLGREAPVFKLKRLDGGDFDLSAHKGKAVVVLDFFATWCRPCRATMPILAEVAESYRDKGVVLCVVNLRETEDKVRGFLDTLDRKVQVALDPRGEVGGLYQVQSIPLSVIIGRDGTVQAVHLGAAPNFKAQLTRELDTLLAGGVLTDAVGPKGPEGGKAGEPGAGGS